MMPEPTFPAPAALQPDVQQALHSFRLIVRSIKLHLQDVQAATGLGASQLWCLAAVKASPGLRMSQLALTLGVRQATASNLVDVLERRGLLERRRDAKDQRVVNLYLTSEGRDKAHALPAPAPGGLPEALGRLEPAALERLNRLLGDVIGLMHGEAHGSPQPLIEG